LPAVPPRPPRTTLLPYTTLFRSQVAPGGDGRGPAGRGPEVRGVRAAAHDAGGGRDDGRDGAGGGTARMTDDGQRADTRESALWDALGDRKSTRLNSSHVKNSYAVS